MNEEIILKKELLDKYQSGAVSWREIAASLGLSSYEDFEALLEEHNIQPFIPEKSEKKMQFLKQILDS